MAVNDVPAVLDACHAGGAQAWICVSPPFQWKTQTLTVDENGFEVDETGQPLPYSISHKLR